MFQSHAGSIEARNASGSISKSSKFQSHAGSIEAGVGAGSPQALKACFNPTLVRLRPTHCAHAPPGGIRFQSHAGSIEAWGPGAEPPGGCGFNPTLVRLRPVVFAKWRGVQYVVSIPRWFD